MRIAIDARPICQRLTGIGRYTHQLLLELLPNRDHQWFIYSDRPLLAELPAGEHIVLRSPSHRLPLPGSVLTQFLYRSWSRRDGIDVFWAPGQHLPLSLPSGIKQVLTIQDLLWREHPETMTFKGRLLDRLFIPRGMRRADRILTISEHVAEAITETFAVSPARIKTIRLAPTPLPDHLMPEFDREISTSRYILFVGTLEPRKNLTAVVTAFKTLLADMPDLRLVVCGPSGWGSETIDSRIQDLGISKSVTVTGFVSDAELHGLYQHCQMLVMPSLYEGFGLPALEALAHGKRVVVSRKTEIARLESPLIHVCVGTDPQSIYTAMHSALSAPPAVEAPPLDLSWEKTAAETLAAFEEYQ